MKIEKEKTCINCFGDLKAGEVFRFKSYYFIRTATPSSAVDLRTGGIITFSSTDEVELKPTAKVVFE